MATLTNLEAYAERIGARPAKQTLVLSIEERDWIIGQIDEELGRNKSVLQRKCSTNIKPKTREKFQRQWAFLNELKEKICQA